MNKPVLVVMAAGMGSRYGGMKQIDPVGPCGQVIVDYSLYDARRAGFETVIFVIKHEIEEAFKAAIGDRVSRVMDVKYAFQQLDELPEGYTIPEGRVKPWGTCHAVLAAKPYIHGPFAVINADDYYGPEAFKVIYDYLSTHTDGEVYDYCMVSYLLKNTVSENGSVARGVCALNEDSTLHSVTERTRIETYEGGIHYTEDGGESWTDLPGETPVSMNLWGFGESFVKEADRRFARWLDENLEKNPLKCEYFLPLVVSELIGEKKAAVKVLRSTDKWYGVTYREDKPVVVEAIAKKIYRADGVNFSAAASKTLAELTELGYGDLPVCIALASSLLDLPVDEKTIAIGEVGLGGEVRSVTHLETRLREAQRVGFDTAIVPKHNLKMIDPSQFPGLKLVGVSYLREAINAIKLK